MEDWKKVMFSNFYKAIIEPTFANKFSLWTSPIGSEADGMELLQLKGERRPGVAEKGLDDEQAGVRRNLDE
jgi:hypothetical protein